MSPEQGRNIHTRPFSPEAGSPREFPLRVLLYSHDSVGLGHLRRNLSIAGEIVGRNPNASVIIVTGSPCATQFNLPERTDLIKIPSITKDADGRYVCHNASRSLGPTVNLRSQMLLQAFRSFEPHLIIMDHRLIGLKGEALEMLREARQRGTLTIYGMRDIKDAPDVIRRHWSDEVSRWALDEAYDRICVYGMPEVFDPRKAYAPLLDETARLSFTGYIVSPCKHAAKNARRHPRKRVLATFGGGGDGDLRALRYLEALSRGRASWDSHVITGPLMDERLIKRLRKMARKIQPIGSVKVRRFHRNIPELLTRVDAVVSMAGYNSCAEILQSGVPAVLLPRSHPRREQVIRATRMSELGWMEVLADPDPDPADLLEAVERALDKPHRRHDQVDLNGLDRLYEIIMELIQSAGLERETASLKQT